MAMVLVLQFIAAAFSVMLGAFLFAWAICKVLEVDNRKKGKHGISMKHHYQSWLEDNLNGPLGPCPHCGSESEWYFATDICRIQCTNPDCRCQSPDIIYEYDPYFPRTDENEKFRRRIINCGNKAIELWNRRV